MLLHKQIQSQFVRKPLVQCARSRCFFLFGADVVLVFARRMASEDSSSKDAVSCLIAPEPSLFLRACRLLQVSEADSKAPAAAADGAKAMEWLVPGLHAPPNSLPSPSDKRSYPSYIPYLKAGSSERSENRRCRLAQLFKNRSGVVSDNQLHQTKFVMRLLLAMLVRCTE